MLLGVHYLCIKISYLLLLYASRFNDYQINFKVKVFLP